ncbi:MAG: glutathione-disulfide reductase [Pseudomonadota bacterium]
MKHFDLFVIGAGSGGVRAARIASGYGAKVGIAESFRIGGTCVIRGCVPKKLLVYASHFPEEFADAKGYGWDVPEAPTFSWQQMIANKDREIDRLNGLYIQTLTNAGVDIFQSHARLLGDHKIDLGTETVTADKILVATGGTPFVPDIPGAQLGFTSNEAFHLDALPKRIVIAGAGYIATEFACIFNGLGVDVTQVYYKNANILRGFDDDMRRGVMAQMKEHGVKFHLGAAFESLQKDGEAIKVALTDGATLETDAVMYAIGRLPNTQDLGLADAGIAVNDRGAISVDTFSKTSVDHIWAVGDVTDRIALTPVAIKEGHAFADTEFGNKPWEPNHESVSSAVFSTPEIATVGLTEDEARSRYGEIDIYKSDFRAMKHVLPARQDRSLFKIIVDRASDRVVGVHLLGPGSAEIMQGVAIAVKMGATKADFDATVAIHPSSAEELVLMREPVSQ